MKVPGIKPIALKPENPKKAIGIQINKVGSMSKKVTYSYVDIFDDLDSGKLYQFDGNVYDKSGTCVYIEVPDFDDVGYERADGEPTLREAVEKFMENAKKVADEAIAFLV